MMRMGAFCSHTNGLFVLLGLIVVIQIFNKDSFSAFIGTQAKKLDFSVEANLNDRLDFDMAQHVVEPVEEEMLKQKAIFEDFITWSSQQGVTHPKLELVLKWNPIYGNAALYANTQIKKKDVLVSVPRKLLFGEHEAYKHPKWGNIFQAEKELLQDRTLLAVFLLLEIHNPDSYWKFYFGTLPETFDTPLFWNAEERKILEGSWILERTLSDEEGMIYEYDRVFTALTKKYPKIFDPAIYTQEAWFWAWSVIFTRGFHVKIDRDADYEITVLVPFADLMNRVHEDQEFYTWDTKRENLLILSGSTFEIDEKVENKWTERSNNDLLRLNGYISPLGKENPGNYVPLKLELFKDESQTWKEKALARIGLDAPPYPYSERIFHVRGAKIPMNVITFLRVKHYKPKDKNKKTMPNPQQEIDKKNEESVVGELVDTLGEIVNRYPTLPPVSSSATHRERLARYVVSEEKTIVRQAAVTIMKLLEFED